MFTLDKILKMLGAIGPVAAALRQFKEVFDDIVATFQTKDQAVLRSAYADVMADNDEGHARLQAKLAEAAKK